MLFNLRITKSVRLPLTWGLCLFQLFGTTITAQAEEASKKDVVVLSDSLVLPGESRQQPYMDELLLPGSADQLTSPDAALPSTTEPAAHPDAARLDSTEPAAHPDAARLDSAATKHPVQPLGPADREIEKPGAGFSATSAVPTQQAQPSQPDDLALLEQRFFSKSYQQESVEPRLARLEKFIFGAEGKGDSKARLGKLNGTLKRQTTTEDNSLTVRFKEPGSQTQKLSLLDQINQGIDNYNKRRYHNAEDDFNAALRLAPGMARTYVYLGVTLLQLEQRRAALDALEAAYELDPFGEYGRYAKNALIVLAGDEEIRRRGPKDDLNTVQKTLTKVNSQAAKEVQRHLNTASQARLYTVRPITTFDLIRSRYVSADRSVQMLNARREGSERARLTQQSANNLKELITAKVLPGDAKLRAFGTTVNARYYGNETPSLAPYYIPKEVTPELKATAASLTMPNATISGQHGEAKAVKNTNSKAAHITGKHDVRRGSGRFSKHKEK